MNHPVVTVYIPSRNRPELLRRAVDSCLTQSYPYLDIIVVDDASDTVFQPQIDQCVRRDPRIRLFRQPEQQGACAARNLAISAATGEFITGLDDDDEFMPDRIAAFVSAWQQQPSASFLCSGYVAIQQNHRYRYARQRRAIELKQLLHANIVGNQIFTRTVSLRAIGGFDTQLPACQDYDAWIRLVQRFGTGYRLANCSYLVHQEHDLPRISNSEKRQTGYQLLLEKHRHVMSPAQVDSHLFYRLLNGGQWQSAQLLCRAGWRHLPVALKNVVLRQYQRWKGNA